MPPIRLAVLLALFPSLAAAAQAPPESYDYPADNAWVIERSPEQIQELCGEQSPWAEGVGACALPAKRCIILWPKGKPRSGILWRHENAHCNGWPKDHPAR
jgi:hypothetical protein